MDVYRPLGAGLFFYECFRLLLLLVFLQIAPPESVNRAFFPYLAYLSSNALFPLIVLFAWLRPEEYRNYLTLHIAGKIIVAASFFAWEIFTSREFPGFDNAAKSMILLTGSALLSMMDILSVWGAWILKNKYRKKEAVPESGGM